MTVSSITSGVPRRPAFDAGDLIADARLRTGLRELDDDGLPARIQELADQLGAHLGHDTTATGRATQVAADLLDQRLQVVECARRHPIRSERIERPIISFGEARSGTTMLQMLLGCDPGSRLLEFWEVMRPTPPPGTADTTERQRQGDEDWREILKLIPRWLISHPYNAMLGRNPPECERLWSIDFRTLNPTTWWRVPVASYEVRLPQDAPRQYEIHRLMLQLLQFQRPARRWVLKGILHQHRLAALLDAYPDGIFVWIHRDPIEAIASRFELQAQIFEGIVGSLDRPAFAGANAALCRANFLSAAENPLAADPRIHHLTYRAVVTNPVAVIRELYDREGLDFSPQFAAAMPQWLADNPAGAHGRFTYSVEEALGDDLPRLHRELDAYRERFGLPTSG